MEAADTETDFEPAFAAATTALLSLSEPKQEVSSIETSSAPLTTSMRTVSEETNEVTPPHTPAATDATPTLHTPASLEDVSSVSRPDSLFASTLLALNELDALLISRNPSPMPARTPEHTIDHASSTDALTQENDPAQVPLSDKDPEPENENQENPQEHSAPQEIDTPVEQASNEVEEVTKEEAGLAQSSDILDSAAENTRLGEPEQADSEDHTAEAPTNSDE